MIPPQPLVGRPPMVVLIRHGATDFNSGAGGERLRGWIDVPLNPGGQAEAAQVAQRIRGLPVAAIYVSDLQRAQATANTVGAAVGVTPQPTPALRPWNAGQLQGQPIGQIKDTLLNHQIGRPNEQTPGGESYTQFLQRFLPFFRWVLAQARAHPEKGVIILVTHTRNLYAAKAWMAPGGGAFQGMDNDVLRDPEQQKTGEIQALVGTPQGWRLHEGST